MNDYGVFNNFKHCWNYFSVNGLFFVILMALMHVSHGSSLIDNVMLPCFNYTSCLTCTGAHVNCRWEYENQQCKNQEIYWRRNYTWITRSELCPEYSVLHKSGVSGSSFTQKIEVTNSLNIMHYLNTTSVKCCLERNCFKGSVVDNSITCDMKVPYPAAAKVYGFVVIFASTIMRFTNETDYFFTVYNRSCDASDEDEGCAVCAWDSFESRQWQYLKLCSADNLCSGDALLYKRISLVTSNAMRTRWNEVLVPRDRCPALSIRSVDPMTTAVRQNENVTFRIEIANHRLLLLNNRTMTVTVASTNCIDPATVDGQDAITCTVATPEWSVIGDEPHAWGLWGPVTVTYVSDDPTMPVRLNLTFAEWVSVVRFGIGHVEPTAGIIVGGGMVRIGFDGRPVTDAGERASIAAYVAGRPCLDPETSDDGTSVTCTAAGTGGRDDEREGPVAVAVTMSDTGRRVTATYAATVKLVDVRLTSVSPASGPVRGGTKLTVTGAHLFAGGDVRVFLNPGRLPCETADLGDGPGDGRIACRTSAADGPGAKRVSVEFKGGEIRADGPAFAYVADPALDPGQRFAAVVSGGTTVWLRGRHFDNALNVSIRAWRPGTNGGSPAVSACRPVNATAVACRSPDFVGGGTDGGGVGGGGGGGGGDDGAGPGADGWPGTAVNVSVVVRLCDGRDEELEPPQTLYVHADPAFVDFDVDDGTGAVALHGDGLDRGYDEDADLTVRFRDSGTGCAVTAVTRRRIECLPDASGPGAGNAGVVLVTVGDALLYTVYRRPAPPDESVRRWSGYHYVSYAATVSLLGLAVCWLCAKTRNRNSYAVESRDVASGSTPSDGRDMRMKTIAQ